MHVRVHVRVCFMIAMIARSMDICSRRGLRRGRVSDTVDVYLNGSPVFYYYVCLQTAGARMCAFNTHQRQVYCPLGCPFSIQFSSTISSGNEHDGGRMALIPELSLCICCLFGRSFPAWGIPPGGTLNFTLECLKIA